MQIVLLMNPFTEVAHFASPLRCSSQKTWKILWLIANLFCAPPQLTKEQDGIDTITSYFTCIEFGHVISSVKRFVECIWNI